MLPPLMLICQPSLLKPITTRGGNSANQSRSNKHSTRQGGARAWQWSYAGLIFLRLSASTPLSLLPGHGAAVSIMIHYRWRYRHSRKISWLLLGIVLFVLWKCIKTPKTDRRTPQYDVVEKPRFLYRSRFRENPDLEYEASIDSALRKIEERILSQRNGNTEADQTIWQIMLVHGPIERSEDSIEFESENDDWDYKVRTSFS